MTQDLQRSLESIAWLQARLRAAAVKYFLVEMTFLCVICASALVLETALYALSDYIVNFPVYIRVPISLSIAGSLVWLARRHIRRRLRKHETSESIARAVELAQERKGASQRSMIVASLQFGEIPQIPGSVELKNEAIRKARTDCVNPVAVALHNRRHMLTAAYAAQAAAVILAVWLAFFGASVSIFLRRAAGLSACYPTDTQIVSVNWKPVAPCRRDYPIEIFVRGKIPAAGTLTVKYPGQRAFDLPIAPGTNQNFLAVVPGPEESFGFRFSMGDFVSEKYNVEIRMPPFVKDGRITVQPPEYTGQPPRAWPVGNFSALEGSAVRFSVQPSRAVKTCDLVVGNAGSPFRQASDGTYLAELPKGALTNSTRYLVRLSSDDGLDNAEQTPFEITVARDAVPRIEVKTPKPNGFMCNLSVLQFVFTAKDDYGINSAAVEYEVYAKKDNNEVCVRKGSWPVDVAVKGSRSLELRLMKQMKELTPLPGEKIVFRAVAADNRTGAPGKGESDQIPVQIVAADELRRIIESEKERTIDLIGKLRDDEKEQADAIQRRLKGGS